MKAPTLASIALGLGLAAATGLVAAQDLLIRGATVHTAGARGTLENTDVLVRNGVIREVGSNLAAPAGATVVEAEGRPLTPGLFAGMTALGLEEVSAERPTVDNAIGPGSPHPPHEPGWRPEFDITPAFNARSSVIGVNRIEGLTFTVLAPSSLPGGSFVTGQGSAVRLDGAFDAELEGSRSLFVDIGGNAANRSGGSRAAQFMLLEQAAAEARPSMNGPAAGHGLLTLAGKRAIADYFAGGRVVFSVHRAADIRQTLAFARRNGMSPVIAGGAEAWVVAEQLAAADVPVFVDALVNLPSSFDQLGATLENAARLHAAGVRVGFSQVGDASHNARKIRQLAGNAVAHGLPWEAALAGLTAVPADVFGFGDRLGRIEPGMQADLVLWSGDPLDVAHHAEQVWLAGRAAPMRSRQTELRDRYMAPRSHLPRAYQR
ncbi:MAG: amidohydrolase family protein [Lysobacteraceae bacterium]